MCSHQTKLILSPNQTDALTRTNPATNPRLQKPKIHPNPHILISTLNFPVARSVKKSGSVAENLKEAQAINKSLSALGDVISALAGEQVSRVGDHRWSSGCDAAPGAGLSETPCHESLDTRHRVH